jgi:hypothetical protein
VRVLLACQEADASPVLRAQEALALATAELSEHESVEPGLFSCGTVRLAAYASTLRLRQGDVTGVLAAADAADAAVRNGEATPSGSWAQVQISAALACLAAGDVPQAAGRLAPVLRLAPGMRLATFNGKLSRAVAMASAAPYRGSPEARTLAEEVRGYLGQEATDVMPYPLALGLGGVK